MVKKFIAVIFILVVITNPGFAQERDSLVQNRKAHKQKFVPEILMSDSITWDSIEIDGDIYSALVKDGDTIILADLDYVNISSPRKFNSRDEYVRYYRYKRYAAIVYPYAVEAVKLFKNIEYDTRDMKRRKRKKYIKGIQKDYETNFEEPLKKLTKMQGKILIKMIERELDTNMFSLVKSVKGKFAAFYWNQFSKLYGYRLKTGYHKGENSILDIVLQDFDIEYDPESREQ